MTIAGNLLSALFFLSASLLNAMSQREIIVLVASDGTEFKINKEIIVQLSPVIKEFLQSELQTTGIEQTRFELSSIKPIIIGSLVQALPLLAPLEKVICEGQKNELRFYSHKEVKKALEKWWQNISYHLKTTCPLASMHFLQNRFIGELLRAAHYLEIEALERYIAEKIAQELLSKNLNDVGIDSLKIAGYGYQSEQVLNLIQRYFYLNQINADEYTLADYILEHGQPKKEVPNRSHFNAIPTHERARLQEGQQKNVISLQNKNLTSLVGLLCIDKLEDVEILDVSNNKLIEIETNQINALPNLIGVSFFSNNIQEIKPRAFSRLGKLTKIQISQNPIKMVDKDAFQDLNQLKELMIARAQVSNLETGAFDNLESLIYLDLSFNKLDSVKPNIFRELKKLEHLRLNHNKITFLNKNSFNGLGALDALSLNSNQLLTLADDVFSEMPNLNHLYLSNNLLSRLPENIFYELMQLRFIDLGNNKLTVLPISFYNYTGEAFLQGNMFTWKTKLKIMYYQELYNRNWFTNPTNPAINMQA